MNAFTPWGLMGPDGLPTVRRVRTLDVGAAVRQFNELAVPGVGSVWASKQILWPLLGIAAATRARESMSITNIEAANAVEALACWMALARLEQRRSTGSFSPQRRDARVRGSQKLQGTSNITFQTVRRPGFYVSQPMRMSAVQPLLSLGMVDSGSERFNAYGISELGNALIDAACAPYPKCWYSHGVVDTLAKWMTGYPLKLDDNETIEQAITPLAALPEEACEILRECLSGRSDSNSLRRRAALAWVHRLRNAPAQGWDAPTPAEFTPEHWTDLHAGACFFRSRDAALAVLDACEQFMGPGGASLSLAEPLPDKVRAAMDAARVAATHFLAVAEGRDYHSAGVQFCRELTLSEPSERLARLVARDGRVVRLSGKEIVPGMVFQGAASGDPEEQDGDEATSALSDRIPLPTDMSFRMRNLFLLQLDLEHQLGDWLAEREVVA